MSSTLNDACSAIVDCEHKTAPEDFSGEFFAVGTPAMRDNIINYDEARRISESTFTAWTRRLRPQAGDLLLAREAPVGPVVKIPDKENVAPGQRTVLLRPDLEVINPDFLFYMLTSPSRQSALQLKAAGSTVPHLNVSDVRSLDLGGLPSLRDQLATTKALRALDDKIAANRRAARVAELLLSSHFQALGLDDEPITTEWAASAVFDFNPLRPKPRRDSAAYLDMSSLPTDGMIVSEWSTRRPTGGARFINGDTLLARITPCLENGKCGYVNFLPEGDVGVGSTEYIVMRSKADFPLELSYFLAKSPRFKAFAIQQMVGSSGRQRLSAKDLADYRLSAVDLTSLADFGRRAAPTSALLRSYADQNTTLATLRDTLLPALMSGRLRVRDAEKIVEDAT